MALHISGHCMLPESQKQLEYMCRNLAIFQMKTGMCLFTDLCPVKLFTQQEMSTNYQQVKYLHRVIFTVHCSLSRNYHRRCSTEQGQKHTGLPSCSLRQDLLERHFLQGESSPMWPGSCQESDNL